MVVKIASEQLLKKQIKELRNDTDFLSTLLENLIGHAILAADLDGDIIAYNEGAHKIYGYAPEEIIGKQNIEIFFPSEFVADGKLRRIIDNLMNTGKFSCDEDKLRKNGERFPARILFVLTRDKTGKAVGFVEIVEDLTGHQQAEHTLKYSEVKYRRLFEAAQDGILILDADTGQINDVNPFLTDMLGYSREELLGKKLWEIGPFKDIEASRGAFQELQSQGYVRYEHLPLENKSGQRMAVEFVSNVYMVNSQRVIQCNIRDITKRMQITRELRESEAHYKELAESISDVFFALDENLRYTYWNKASEKLTGIPAKDALGKHLYDIFPNIEQTRMAEKAYKKALKTKKPQHFANEYSLGGKDISFEISAYPSKSGLSIFAKDVTGSKRIENRWWDSMSNFHKVVNNSADGIIITSGEGVVRFVNPAAESFFGRKSEDFNGEHFGFPITSGETTEIEIIRKAGETVTAEMRVAETMWYDEMSYLISLDDISERKQAQQAQERLSQQLKEKVSELEAFSYAVAHDLRSPLVSIQGFVQMLQTDIQEQKTESVREDIRIINSGVKKMGQLIKASLEYSRAGQLVKPVEDVPFGEIVDEVITEFGAQVRSIGANISLADNYPLVYADRLRVREVLTNLIQNSINYRDKDRGLEIDIGYKLAKDEVIFFVHDNGVGIDTSEAEKVFELFYRGTVDGEGIGAGLAIVKRIIEAHGGRIWVEGQSGVGTTIYFALHQKRDQTEGDADGKD